MPSANSLKFMLDVLNMMVSNVNGFCLMACPGESSCHVHVAPIGSAIAATLQYEGQAADAGSPSSACPQSNLGWYQYTGAQGGGDFSISIQLHVQTACKIARCIALPDRGASTLRQTAADAFAVPGKLTATSADCRLTQQQRILAAWL